MSISIFWIWFQSPGIRFQIQPIREESGRWRSGSTPGIGDRNGGITDAFQERRFAFDSAENATRAERESIRPAVVWLTRCDRRLTPENAFNTACIFLRLLLWCFLSTPLDAGASFPTSDAFLTNKRSFRVLPFETMGSVCCSDGIFRLLQASLTLFRTLKNKDTETKVARNRICAKTLPRCNQLSQTNLFAEFFDLQFQTSVRVSEFAMFVMAFDLYMSTRSNTS